MVSVTPDTFTTEHGRETQALGHLVFGNHVVATFGLTNDEFANL